MTYSFQNHKDNLFVVDPSLDKSFTYQQFSEYSEVWNGVFGSSRSLVFLYAENSLSFLSCYFYLLQSRHVVHLGDAKLSDEIKGIGISSYCPDFIVVPQTANPKISGYTELTSPFEALKVYKYDGQKTYLNPDLKLLLSTSGSTGSPKLVKISEQALWANASSIREYLELSNGDRAIMTLPMSYSYGLSVINSHIVAGASLIVNASAVNSRQFWDIVKKYSPNSFAGVPQTYRALLALGLQRLPLQSFSYFTQAGGKMPLADIEKVQNYCQLNNKKLFVMYGQTEATARIAYVPAEMLNTKMGSVGVAIPGGTLEIASIGLGDDKGELVFKGQNVMMGYALDKDDLGKSDDMNGVLHTGDLGYIDNDGFAYVTGRIKRFIKINGYRYGLDEIQSYINGSDGDIVCTGRDELLVVAGSFGKDPEIIKNKLKDQYQIHPSNILMMELKEIPLNLNGKPSYDAILSMIEGHSD